MVSQVPKGIPGLFNDRDAMDKDNLRKRTIQFSARQDEACLDDHYHKFLNNESENFETESKEGIEIFKRDKNILTLRNTPRWITHDKIVLRYYGYFDEEIDFMQDKEIRRRHLQINLFTSDNTIQIFEPKQKNSGIIQGPFLKRMSLKSFHLTVADFQIGSQVKLLGRDIVLYKCDRITRLYFRKEVKIILKDDLDIEVPKENTKYSLPARAGLTLSQENQQLNAHRFNGNFYGNLKKYLEYGEDTLKFLVYWHECVDSTEKRYFTILYHLCDDTLEIREKKKTSVGRATYVSFLKRTKPLNTETNSFFHWFDFKTGYFVKINERNFFIISCDEDTENFYRDNMKHEQTCSLIEYEEYIQYFSNKAKSVPQKVNDERERMYNQKRAFRKQKEYGDQTLKMRIRLLNDTTWTREFVLSFYLADEQISLYEPPSSIGDTVGGGRFLEKNRYINNDTGNYFSLKEFKYILNNDHACFSILKRKYEVIFIDKFTKNFLDVSFKNNYPRKPSGFRTICEKAIDFVAENKVDFRRVFFEEDSGNFKHLSKLQVRRSFERLSQMGLNYSQPEVEWIQQRYCSHGRFYYIDFCISLTRRINTSGSTELGGEAIENLEQLEKTLNTKLQNEGQSLRILFRKFDADRSGTLTFTEFQELLRYFNIFLTVQQVSIIMAKYDKDQQGTIDYNEFYDRIECLQHKRSTEHPDITLETLSLKDFHIWDAPGNKNKGKAYLETVQCREDAYNQEAHNSRVIERFVILCSRRRTKFRQIFRQIDDSKDGKLSRQEFTQAIQMFNEFSESDRQTIMNHFYKSKQRDLSYEQFMEIIAALTT